MHLELLLLEYFNALVVRESISGSETRGPSLHRQGRLITICDIESPPAYPCMVHMNFPKEYTDIMSSLNWATADEEYTPSE